MPKKMLSQRDVHEGGSWAFFVDSACSRFAFIRVLRCSWVCGPCPKWSCYCPL